MTMETQSGTETNSMSTGYSEDYVKSLREEAASWRVKFRELETNMKSKEIEVGLAQRGLKAKPSWVEVKEGQTVAEALDEFAKEYSHLAVTKGDQEQQTEQLVDQPTVKKVFDNKPKPMTPPAQKVAINEVKDLNRHLADRSVTQLKDDPKSRKLVQEFYQDALAQRR